MKLIENLLRPFGIRRVSWGVPQPYWYIRFRVGLVTFTFDREGGTIEGGLWPYNNYRVDAHGDVTHIDDPGEAAPVNDLRRDRHGHYSYRHYHPVPGDNKPPLTRAQAAYAGYYVWRNHAIDWHWLPPRVSGLTDSEGSVPPWGTAY